MDASIIQIIGTILSLAGAGFAIYRSNSSKRIEMEKTADDFARKQILDLQRDIRNLNTKIEDDRNAYNRELRNQARTYKDEMQKQTSAFALERQGYQKEIEELRLIVSDLRREIQTWKAKSPIRKQNILKEAHDTIIEEINNPPENVL